MLSVLVGKTSKEAFIKFAQQIAKLLPTSEAGSRFSRLFDVSKKSKYHDYFILAGPIGAYMLLLAADDLGGDQRTAMTLLLQVCGDLWEKVVWR